MHRTMESTGVHGFLKIWDVFPGRNGVSMGKKVFLIKFNYYDRKRDTLPVI